MASQKKKILFIEDEPDQQMMVRLRLEKSDFFVVTAGDGEEGLKKAVAEKPELILLDIVMPGMDGFEVMKKLRENSITKKIPIIATTAAGSDDLEQACFNSGANDCLRKPYDAKDLLMKVHKLLQC